TTNLELVRSIGADEVIDYTREDFTDNAASYDIIFDATGTAPLHRCEKALRRNGRLLVVLGSFATALGLTRPARGSGKKVIAGVTAPTLEHLVFLAKLAEAGEYKPVIDRSYPMENAVEAHTYVDTGHKRGSVVMNVA
ncbi:MAG TPA: zinc-binding dehydrogenase, partial [Polyangiaceae bacterium]